MVTSTTYQSPEQLAHQKERRRRAAMIAIIVHLIVLLMLWWFGMWREVPEPPPTGMMINFGAVENGGGEKATSPKTPEKEVQPEAQPEKTPTKTEPAPAQDVETQTVEETTSVPDVDDSQAETTTEPAENSTPTDVTNEEEVEKTQEEEQVVDENDLLPSDINMDDDKSGEGPSNGNEDAGDPNGGDSDKYDGVTSGTTKEGHGWGLSGRGITGTAKLPNKGYNQNGHIEFKIRVDRSGKIIAAEYSVSGSNPPDSELIEKARLDLMANFKANPDPKAPLVQSGTFRYNFKVK